MSHVWVVPVQYIKGNWKFCVGRIEIDGIVYPGRRNIIKDFLDQIAMRVKYGQAVFVSDILHNTVEQQGRFAHAGFPNYISVSAAVLGLNAEPPPDIAVIGLSQNSDFLFFHLSNTN